MQLLFEKENFDINENGKYFSDSEAEILKKHIEGFKNEYFLKYNPNYKECKDYYKSYSLDYGGIYILENGKVYRIYYDPGLYLFCAYPLTKNCQLEDSYQNYDFLFKVAVEYGFYKYADVKDILENIAKQPITPNILIEKILLNAKSQIENIITEEILKIYSLYPNTIEKISIKIYSDSFDIIIQDNEDFTCEEIVKLSELINLTYKQLFNLEIYEIYA